MKVELIYSEVWRCFSCNTWYTRIPKFMGMDDFAECEKCGCTSFNVTDGRPYGPRFHGWEEMKKRFVQNIDWINAEESLHEYARVSLEKSSGSPAVVDNVEIIKEIK